MTTETKALAKVEAESPQRGQWTTERIDLVKRTIVPKGIDNDAFALFMEQCKRSGLDPLLKEAFCVPRKHKVSEGKWAERFEFQPSEAGMLARAERFPDFRGIQASAVYAEDDILVDQGEGQVVHKFNPAKRKGALVGAWSRVVRKDKLPVVVWLDFAGYVQQTPLWSKIPTTMIEKCARVAALRKAYPEAFGGLYIREEMPAEEYPEESQEKPKERHSKTEEAPQGAKPAYGPPVGPEMDPMVVEGQFQAAQKQVGQKPSDEDSRVIIGRHKGKAIADLDKVSLEQALEDAKAIVANKDYEKKRTYPLAVRSYAILQAEEQFRRAPPEPGSDG